MSGDAVAEARRDWTTLGDTDPLWAVLVWPGTKDGAWNLEEFLATGRADVAATTEWLAASGLATRWERALDFGCGVGRLSQALAEHADEVIGVDISPPMLAAARRIDRSGGVCSFVHNDSADLSRFPAGHFDLIYSMLVLQHLPRSAIELYLAEFLRVLRPGGTAVLQIPTRVRWTAKGLIWRALPFAAIRLLQTRFLRYPAPMRMTVIAERDWTQMVRQAGGVVVSQLPDPSYTEDFVNIRFALRRA